MQVRTIGNNPHTGQNAKEFTIKELPNRFHILSKGSFTEKPRKAPFLDLEATDLRVCGGMSSASEKWTSEMKKTVLHFWGHHFFFKL